MMGGAGAGSLAQLGNDLINQSVGYAISAKSASDDWDRYKNSITRGFQYKMEGLKNAGLNPIMAVQGGLGVGAPGLPKTGPTRTGGSVGNPSLQASQAAAARAAALQAGSAKALLDEQRLGVGFDNVAKGELAKYINTAEGADDLRRAYKNKSYPDNFPAGIIKGGGSLKDKLKQMFRPADPGQTSAPRAPRDYELERQWQSRPFKGK